MGWLGKIVVCVLLLSLCAACARVASTVNRTDLLPPTIEGRTVFVLPSNEQESSAEFVRYREILYRELEGVGLRRATKVDTADYVAFVAYGVSGSRTQTSAIPIYGQTGGGTTYQSGTVNTMGRSGPITGTYSGTSYQAPTMGIVGFVPYTTVKHSRYLSLRIVERSASPDQPRPVYEGQVVSAGSSESFAQVSNCLFSALFKNFRKAGSERIEVSADSCLSK